MARFKFGMGCCRVSREQAELCCEYPQQLACAVSALVFLFKTAPDQAERLLFDLFPAFPDRIATFLAEAELAGMVDTFIACAARSCAALPTKAERHAFRDQISDRLCATDLAAFDDRMSAEWRRMRGK